MKNKSNTKDYINPKDINEIGCETNNDTLLDRSDDVCCEEQQKEFLSNSHLI